MFLKKIIIATCVTGALLLSGCAVITVATTAVSVASTAVGVGVTVGSSAVGAAATVVKGTVNLATGSSDKAAE